MRNVLDPFRFIVIAIACWMNQKQHNAIDYSREENRVLREQLGTRRLRFTDDQRRRLAAKAKLDVLRNCLCCLPDTLRIKCDGTSPHYSKDAISKGRSLLYAFDAIS